MIDINDINDASSPRAKVTWWYTRAQQEALKHVELLARHILLQHPELDEYVMAMGCAFFSDNQGRTISIDKCEYMKPLALFIGEWDEYLKLTGEPMRFAARGEVVTDW